MALQNITTKTNTVAVIAQEGGGIQILSNGTVIHPAGGADNNPVGKFLSQLAEPLAQTEQIEDPAMKEAFRSAIADQIKHVMALNMAGQNNHVLTCEQMEQTILKLEQQANRTTNRRQHDFLVGLIDSDRKVLEAICNKGSQVP